MIRERFCNYSFKYDKCNLTLECCDCIIFKDWELNHKDKIERLKLL
jgi:hypothetical protein